MPAFWAAGGSLASESLLRGLRRDDFLRLLQKERLVEAPLSVMLQAYSTFFLTTNAIAYFVAICSLMGSSLSLSLACVFDFDLGIDTVARMNVVRTVFLTEDDLRDIVPQPPGPNPSIPEQDHETTEWRPWRSGRRQCPG